MDRLVIAFGPAFAAAVALQQGIELFKPAFAKLGDKKTIVIRVVSLVVGLVLAFGAGLRVLAHLGYSGPVAWDAIVTGLIISGGTEGFNSVLKFLGYTKVKKAAEAKKASQ